MTFKTFTLTLALGLLFTTQAFAQRAFDDADVQRAREYYQRNASAGSATQDCLETLNEGLRLLYNDRSMRLSSTVDRSMQKLIGLGRAEQPRVFGFFDTEGRSTYGVTEPATLRESVWDGLVAIAGNEPGWHVFGFSPLDGNHSVTLYLDTRDGSPKVYWADQWSTKGGFKLYATKAELDGEIERLTASWWRTKLRDLGVKFKTDAKIYPLLPVNAQTQPEQPPAAEGDQEAEVIRAARLNLRSGPGTDHGRVASARLGERYRVVGREGPWVQLERENGERVWAHGAFLRVRAVPRGGAIEALRGASRQ